MSVNPVNHQDALFQKINARTAIVGVIGLGYVGLPLAVEKAKAGFKTIGFDIQAHRVTAVNEGHNYIGDILDEDLMDVVSSGMLKATADFSFIEQVDCVAICVPTPLDAYQQPDISYVRSSSENIAQYLHKGMLVVLESTTYPGTTEDLVKPILEKGSGLACGEDFFLAFSPERVDPGNKLFKTKNTPKVVGGIGKESTAIAAALYRAVLNSDVFEASSPRVAEMEKILENTYRNINIALANEMAIICDKMGINVWEVIDAAKTKPYGFQAFYPGPGVGGHCIPLDPWYLTWKAREYGYHTRLIETAGEINNGMPDYVISRIARILNRKSKALRGAKILVLGVAYKPDIDDCRESPAIKVIEGLIRDGALVDYHDPFIPEIQLDGETMHSLMISDIAQAHYDVMCVTTKHTAVSYESFMEIADFVLDTKNAMNCINSEKYELL